VVSWFLDTPGRIYVLATLLPVAAFVLIIISGLVRNLARPYRRSHPSASFLYYLFGGDRPLRAGAYFATGVIALAAVLAIVGLASFLRDAGNPDLPPEQFQARWAEHIPWAQVGPAADAEGAPRKPAVRLELGYRIDHLTAVLFAMVTVISTGIFLFSIGYMRDEADEVVSDHEVSIHFTEPDAHGETHGEAMPEAPARHPHGGHLQRRGRYGRFFLYLSLF
jgi:NADH-quinone oxidoreductase subunit L